MVRLTLCAAALVVSAGFGGPVPAQEHTERSLPVNGRISADGSLVELDWFGTDKPRVGAAAVQRRNYGQVGGGTWRPLSAAKGGAMRYSDATTEPGQAYEYQVIRFGTDIIDVGYWLTGTRIPASESQKRAILVVDKTLSVDLKPRLDRLERDLEGDGWQVIETTAPRNDPTNHAGNLNTAATIRSWLIGQYEQAPEATHAVLLIGHIPILKSGNANPDGHDSVPHATDLFYGDADGVWSLSGELQVLDNQLPSDFIEMQVGRIDFAPVSDRNRDVELHHLRRYFDKNHHWRQGLLGDLRAAYGQGRRLAGEVNGVRNIVGAASVTEGGHHDAAETQPWLWGVDSGDWDGRRYFEKHSVQSVFAINFGSGKQKIDGAFNGLTALLAQPWYVAAVGWGGRPTWWLHHMALGGTIGDAHMRTVNNGRAQEPYRDSMDYFPTGEYLWRNPVWVNLLGDPTLRAFVLASPTAPRAKAMGDALTLTWTASPDPDLLGYKVYRWDSRGRVYRPISGSEPIRGTEFTDTAPPVGARYMIRAYGLRKVYAGSFYTLSQGAFVQADIEPPGLQDIAFTANVGKPFVIPMEFEAADGNQLRAFVAPPTQGTLEFVAGKWVLTPPEGFTGDVVLRFSVSGPGGNSLGRLRLTFQ